MCLLSWVRQNRIWIGSAALVLATCLVGTGSSVLGATAYSVDHSRSHLLAVTNKAGLFSFAGHRHAILAREWTFEESIDPSNLGDASVSITIPTSSLVVDSAEARRLAGLGAGPGEDDVRTIQKHMLSPDMLDASKYPHIKFVTTRVDVKGRDELVLMGEFEMHGWSRGVQVPVTYSRGDDGQLRVSGRFSVKQTDFGIEPNSAGLGTVRVADEVQISIEVFMSPSP